MELLYPGRVKREAALTATRRDDLEHGTNAAYIAACVWRLP
jgi:hypothetical protein